MPVSDKVAHFLVSFVLGLLSPAVSYAAGIGKEVYDAATGGVVEVADLYADWAGILVALLVSPVW